MLTSPLLNVPVSPAIDDATASALDKRKADAHEQLEAVFISMLIKELRTTGSEDGLFAGDTSDTFGGLFDSFLGDQLAAAGGLGIRELLENSSTDAVPDVQQIHQLATEAYRHAATVTTAADAGS